jgi:MoaA/NifB/PqqE/SkfB family radical SAM enzyme
MSLGKLLKITRVFRKMQRREPTFVSYNISNVCNEACPMCSVWQRRSGEVLSIDEMEQIFRDLYGFGFMVTEISGGEPFLRQDIFDAFAMLDRIGFLYTTATNGTLLTPESIEHLRQAKGLLQLAVSIDSLDRELYRRLRGRDLLETLLGNIELLVSARLPFPVKLNLVMNRFNYRETLEILSYAKERKLYLSVFPVNLGEGFLHRSNPEEYRPDDRERREMAELFRELARLRKRGEPLWEYSGFYEKAADYVEGKPVGPCDAAGLYIDLHADGGVSVCVDQPVIADLRSSSIAEIWPQVAAQRAEVARCSGATPCFYTCTYNISITARNEAAFLLETAGVRLRRFLAG